LLLASGYSSQVAHEQDEPPLSQYLLGQLRSTQRKFPRGREDEQRLTADIIELARQYGR
jgi:hypothetical protein